MAALRAEQEMGRATQASAGTFEPWLAGDRQKAKRVAKPSQLVAKRVL
jgi:hypothetical protein